MNTTIKSFFIAIIASSAIFAQPVATKQINNNLFAAVETGNRKAVKKIISNKKNKQHINALNDQHKTALDIAAEHGHIKIAQDLISRGGQVTSEKNANFLKDNLKTRALKFFVLGWFLTPFLWIGSVTSLNKASNLYVLNV